MPTKKKKQPFYRENLSLKLISLILAVLLELYFYSPDNSVTVTLPANVELQNTPPNTMIMRPFHGERGIPARIELKGPRPVIEQVKNEVHVFRVNHPGNDLLNFTVSINRDQLPLPNGVELIEVRPRSVTFELERVITKEVPVKAERQGEVVEGFQLDRLTVSPGTVLVRGPRSEVEQLQEVRTEPIDIAAFRDHMHKEVLLLTPARYTTLGINMVTIDAQVVPIPALRTFERVGIKLRAPQGFAGTVEPAAVKVTLSGPTTGLNKLGTSQLVLLADAEALGEGKHEVPITGENLPEDVTIRETVPEKVTVNLVKQNG